jgi:hypothetical protein
MEITISKRTLKVVGILALAAGLLFVREALRPQPDDRTRILALLQEGATAVQEKNVGHTMSLISSDYHDREGRTKADLLALAVGYFRDAGSIAVAVNHPQIRLNGETAMVTATVTVDVAAAGQLTSARAAIPVTLTLAREPARRLLILPDHCWRVVSATFASPWSEMDLF